MPTPLQIAPKTTLLVTGRVGVGKSQFLYHLAIDHSQRGQRVQLWSRDLDPNRLSARLRSHGAGHVEVISDPITESLADVAIRKGVDLLLIDDIHEILMSADPYDQPVGSGAAGTKIIVDTARAKGLPLVATMARRGPKDGKDPNVDAGVGGLFDEYWWFRTTLNVECLRGADTTRAFYVEPLVDRPVLHHI